MSNTKKPESNNPPVNADATPAEPGSPGSGTVSRRDFLTATAVSGIALGAGSAAPALAQDSAASSPAAAPQGAASSPLPTGESFEMYEGTAAGAVLAQLRAAGVHTIFHTNTSGYGALFEAVDRAGDVQVINVTHEGHAVAAAAGYAMASRTLGFFFGSGVGVGNSMSNLYCAWKDRVPLLVTFGGGQLNAQGKDRFERWGRSPRPHEALHELDGELSHRRNRGDYSSRDAICLRASEWPRHAGVGQRACE